MMPKSEKDTLKYQIEQLSLAVYNFEGMLIYLITPPMEWILWRLSRIIGRDKK